MAGIVLLALILTVGAVVTHGRRKRARPAGGNAGSALHVEVERAVRARLYGSARRSAPGGVEPPARPAWGRYQVIGRVGAGGTATVYHAWDERLRRDVALKVIEERLAGDPKTSRRLRREAEIAAGLTHPNIVTILDAGSRPREFVVMELVRGCDARALLRSRGALAPAEAVHLVAQVCDALAYAHDRDVLHHDVSLGNILISRSDGVVKLADFGVGAAAGHTGPVTATPGYVAPEVLYGAGASVQSDLYALAVVAYRLLAGRIGARRSEGHATAPLPTARLRMPVLAEARPSLPRGLCDAVQQALAPDPAVRQASVAEFRAQLIDEPGAPRPVAFGSARRETARRRLPRAA